MKMLWILWMLTIDKPTALATFNTEEMCHVYKNKVRDNRTFVTREAFQCIPTEVGVEHISNERGSTRP